MDQADIKTHLRRTPWGNFPEVVIYAEPIVLKRHASYAAAKGGDAIAAEALVEDILATEPGNIGPALGDNRPHLLAVHALETVGMNAIPRAFARTLSRMLKLPLASGIIQINRVTHTGADGYHRLALPALFGGEIEKKQYFLVDDFVGQGGTLANLKGFVETSGGSVLGAVALGGKAYSAKLRLHRGTLEGLRRKHGAQLEEWWIATFGYGFERLTESEARYLTRSDDAHAIPERLAAARRTRD